MSQGHAHLWLVFGLLLASPTLCAQKHRVEFTSEGDQPAKWLRAETVGSVEQVPSALTAMMARLYARGYLEASIDTCLREGTLSVCQVQFGTLYRWARLSGSGIAPEIASEARFREKLYGGRAITPVQVARLFEDLLRRAENSGHPFARVWLDSLRQDRDGLSATLRMEMGRTVIMDSVVVRGTAKTNLRYLESHIGIRPGDPYNEALIRNVERRVRELPFVTQKQRPYVQFAPTQTKLFLFLDAKKASSINGILGVQPDPNTSKVTITGDLDLRLRNALKRGEAIALNWRSVADRTQELRLSTNVPMLFNTPFGVDANLRLFKRDTTFLEVVARLGLDYLLQQGDKLSLFVNTKQNNRLGSNTVSQPGLADVNIISYGLGLERERFDYRLNPRSGHALRMEGSAGRKRSSTAIFAPGAEVPPEVRTVQYDMIGLGAVHIPLRRRSTIRLAAQGGWMVNDDLHRNELFRIGGLKTMRGVDEASLICSAYAIGTLEYRFVYEENANFFAFVDQGWWEDRSGLDPISDSPLGFGLGTTFETKAGLFNLTYALARQFNNPIELSNGKIHFGFVSLF